MSEEEKQRLQNPLNIPARLLVPLADLVAKAVVDRIPQYMLRRPKRKVKTKKYENPLILDTSAIIDGRIADIARVGFLVGNVLVTDYVLLELKRVADSQDLQKRSRGRRGLELLEQMKKMKGVKLSVVEEKDSEGKKEVDERLITFTKKQKGRLVTCDYNLNKKATVQGVSVLNINDLANSLKMVALPNEKLTLTIVAEGKGKNQGVGYLTDGTMVVVENGNTLIGKEQEVVVSRVLQTPAGKMIFAKPQS